jgi:microcompartment protein CcmL/EutN
MQPAIAVLEFSSVADGIIAGDAMIKGAPLTALRTGTVQPGKYLVLVGGDTASVEEAVAAGEEVGSQSHLSTVFLPDVHPDVVEAIRGARAMGEGEALGIIETTRVTSLIQSADSGRKAAAVTLLTLEMADGLGGKGYLLFVGTVAEVEAAVEAGVGSIPTEELVASRLIAQLHPEMREDLVETPFFWEAVREPKE